MNLEVGLINLAFLIRDVTYQLKISVSVDNIVVSAVGRKNTSLANKWDASDN